MKVKQKFIILMILFLVVSCAGVKTTTTQSPEVTAYKALVSGKLIYDNAFKTMAVLDSQGKLPVGVKDKAIKAGNIYMTAHNTAVQLLLDGKTPNLATVSQALDDFLLIVAKYYTLEK